MSRALLLPASLAALLSTACGDGEASAPPQTGGQTGGETPPCSRARIDEIEFDTVTENGVSGANALRVFGAPEVGALMWNDGTQTGLAFALSYAGRTRYVRDCRELLLDVTLKFATDDGAFNDAVPAELRAYSMQSADLTGELPVSELQGSFRTSKTNVAGSSLRFRVLFINDDAQGKVERFLSTNESGAGEPIATF